jgi:quinol monooxygenase YgiN
LFIVLEIWESETSLEAHRQSAHMVEFKQTCGGMITEKVALDLAPLDGFRNVS